MPFGRQSGEGAALPAAGGMTVTGSGRRGGAARRRSRGHGPARLDGTRPRATVAVKVMKSGETVGHGNGPSARRQHGKRSAQARIAIRAGGISDVKGGQFLNARSVPVQIVNDHGMTVPASVCLFAQVRMIWR